MNFRFQSCTKAEFSFFSLSLSYFVTFMKAFVYIIPSLDENTHTNWCNQDYFFRLLRFVFKIHKNKQIFVNKRAEGECPDFYVNNDASIQLEIDL